MADFLLGMEGKLYYGDAEALLGAMTELTNVRNVKLSLPRGEADISTRANSGWKGTAPTLRECSVEFEMLWKPSDAGFAAIRAAYLGTGTIELAVLSQARDVAGAEGPKGLFSVMDISRDEDLENAMIASVTCKLAVFREWVSI